MARELTAFEKKKEKKFVRMRRILIVVFILGLVLFSGLHIQMGDHGAKNIVQVYGLLLGGLMVFAGGMGIGATSLFLSLLRKDKDKAW
jgi:hypothetical protein